ncbi:MAG: MalY/PatB family protein [Acidimicrobiales bacterium]
MSTAAPHDASMRDTTVLIPATVGNGCVAAAIIMDVGQDGHDFGSLDDAWLHAKPGRKWHHASPRLAAWVADMDFRPAPAVTAHLSSILEGGDVGYPERDDRNHMRAVGAFVGWMEQRHGWSPDPDGIREWNDVVQAVQAVLHVATQPGDGVVLHVPAYPPFFDAIEQTKCRPVTAPARIKGNTVVFDHDELERTIARESAKVMILCNPQNPTGHVFTRDELVRLTEIAVRHDLLVISDEIHADIVFDGHRHIPFATVPGAADRTITVTSASKSFNLAGLRYAVTHCGAGWVEERFAALPHHLFGATNIFGAEAAWAAWTLGAPWFDDVRAHLEQMRDATIDLVRDRLPGVTVHRPDATYLAWLDCSNTAIAADPHAAFAAAGVETSAGTGFGPGGEGHVRLNFATSSMVLTRIIETMATALQ